MDSMLSVLLFLGIWFAVQVWLLPKLGVPT